MSDDPNPSWALVASLPQHRIYRQNQSTPHVSELHEFIFYDPAALSRFISNRDGIARASHKCICGTKSVNEYTDGRVWICYVEWEVATNTLENELFDRRKRGESWSETDLKAILTDLVGGLAHAQKENFFASDVSSFNVNCYQNGYQIRDIHSKPGLDLSRLRVASLSPELRTIYSHWVLTSQVQSDDLDMSKSAVYSLGLLVLSLIGAIQGDTIVQHSDIVQILTETDMPKDVKTVLEAMLILSVSDRPDMLSLEAFLNQTFNSVANCVATLQHHVDALNFSDAQACIDTLLQIGIAATVTFPCSLCKSQIAIPANCLSFCEKHLICSLLCLVNSSKGIQLSEQSKCPACERPVEKKRRLVIARPKQIEKEEPERGSENKCVVCGKLVTESPSERWRLQLLGSNLQFKARTCCSQACFESDSKQAEELKSPESTLDDLEADYFPEHSKTMIARVIIEHITINFRPSANVMLLMKMRAQVNSPDEYMVSEFSGSLPKIFEGILDTMNCHFCKEAITDWLRSRWIACGSGLQLVCSLNCVCAFLDVDETRPVSARVCPSCNYSISASRIRETLSFKTVMSMPVRSSCENCGGHWDTKLACGHIYCTMCCEEESICTHCLCLLTLRKTKLPHLGIDLE